MGVVYYNRSNECDVWLEARSTKKDIEFRNSILQALSDMGYKVEGNVVYIEEVKKQRTWKKVASKKVKKKGKV
jgi:hypothetical protein|tara:strand:+ start:21858 stop:22076 length:219 start_codon:yes stop_codon:yes gene_type:complete